MSFDTVRRQLARNVVRHAAKHAKKKLSHEFQPGGDLDLTAMGQQDSSEGATLVLGGLAISVALMLAAFVVFSLVRDMQRSDAEIEKAREGASRGVIQAKSFRGWAVLGIVICVLVMKHIHHISTQPALTHEQAVHMVKAPIEENPTVRALTMGGTHTEEEARQKIHEHIQANPHLLAPRKIEEAKDEHLVIGGLAASMVLVLGAYLVIDTIREHNRQSFKPQTEQDRRAALRCWATIGIIICLVVVKHLHHASEHVDHPLKADMHSKHLDKEAVEGGHMDSHGPKHSKKEWVEEHGVLRVKQVKDEVSGDQRLCAYEKERCMCDGHVRFGDGDKWTAWRDAVQSIECTCEAFGEDPAPHKVKICQCRPEIRDCANENELCHCPGGRVRYGMGTKWTDWVMLESEDKVLCSNAEFGDPHSGKKKICQCEESLPEQGIESPNGLEPGDDIIDDGYLEKGKHIMEEDRRTAGHVFKPVQHHVKEAKKEAGAEPVRRAPSHEPDKKAAEAAAEVKAAAWPRGELKEPSHHSRHA